MSAGKLFYSNYIELIKQILRDDGDLYFYDVNQRVEPDNTQSLTHIDQILNTRRFNRDITSKVTHHHYPCNLY